MRQKLTDKQKGLILFGLFAFGLIIIAIFAIMSSIPKSEDVKYSTPKPTEEISVPNQDAGNPTLEAKRVNKLLAILNPISGFDYSFPPDENRITSNPDLSSEAKNKLINIYKSYDIPSLTSEKYVKTVSLKKWVDVSTAEDDKKGYYVYEVDATVEEGKNDGPVTPVGTERWKITIQERESKNVIVDFQKIS